MSTIPVQLLCQLFCILFGAGQFAWAQDLGIDRPRTLHADVGGFVSKVLPMDGGGVGLRFDISTSPRLAFEVGVEWMEAGRRQFLPDQIVWFYSAQARHVLQVTDRDDSFWFVTYGVAGWVERNGTFTGLETRLVPPFAPLTGIGAQRRVSTHLAIRGDASLIWMFGSEVPLATPRLTGGLSILIGS